MFRIALKSTMAHKGRMLLTSLAVIAGCAFLSGVNVFSDTIRGSFDRLFASAFEHTDAFVRSSNVIEGDFGAETRDRLPDSLLAEVAQMPGVASVEPNVQGYARITNAEGDVVGVDGPPKFGANFSDDTSSPWSLVEGHAPEANDQVVIDKLSSKQGDIDVGDTVTITAQGGSRQFTVVGIAEFAGSETTGGANWALFDLATAQQFVLNQPGLVDSISVVGDGSMSDEQLASELESSLQDRDIEVLTGAEITDENQSDVEEGLSFFTIFLTIFAAISLFVGCFIIFNVFSISAAHRQQENALLRAIGASRGQVTRVLFVEALVVGVFGGLVGFGGGVALALIIIQLLKAIGFATADTSLIVEPAVLVTSLVVGVAVTILCAIVPAIRSGRVPPLAAMRDVAVDRSAVSRSRVVIGLVCTAIAVLGVALGISQDPLWLAPGIVGLFVAFIVLGPVFVAPIARFIGRPLGAVRGVTGAIAGRNAATSPKRTALTAGALGIGLALLVGVSTLGSSVKTSIRQSIGEQFTGDFAVTSSETNSGYGGLPTTMVDQLNDLPQVEAAVGLGINLLTLQENGESKGRSVLVTNPEQASAVLDMSFVAGGWADLTADGILVSSNRADDDGLAVGDVVDATLLDGTSKQLTVQGIYDADDFGNLIVSRDLFAGQTNDLFDLYVWGKNAPGVSDSQAETAIRTVTNSYPASKVQTRSEFIDDQSKQVDGFLNFIYALLLMSVFIAVLGIVITLLLAVYERRRELGLMRAVGMTRPQMRSSVRWEAVVTAFLGALMGIGLGLALGWVVVKALEDEGLNSFSISIVSIVVFAVAALVVAVLAAWIPARRA
ncbi:MAG: ABC transporter permease, partial [Ilumatobacteraceae bacterium]